MFGPRPVRLPGSNWVVKQLIPGMAMTSAMMVDAYYADIREIRRIPREAKRIRRNANSRRRSNLRGRRQAKVQRQRQKRKAAVATTAF